MECRSACFTTTLHYESPAHGGWGVIRVAALVPEVYMLFVSPFACGRHGALGGIINGVKDKVSYLFIGEKEIVSGDYEAQVFRAIEELFAFLKKKPRVLFLFVSCLDDMLGTDHAALDEKLEQTYPDVLFRSCHMNPIQSDTPLPPLVSLNRNMYSLLSSPDGKEAEHFKNYVNLIGNNVLPVAGSELYRIMGDNGIRVRHISECKTFDEYYAMRTSGMNIVLSPAAAFAARDMEKNPGIPYFLSYVTYDPDGIKDMYGELAKKLSDAGMNVSFDIEREYENAKASLRETAAFLDGTPVAIDFQAVKQPCALAKTLISYGFTVKLLAVDKILPFEKESFEWLKTNAPHLEIASPLHHDSPKFAYRSYSDCLCIGFDCGYMTGSEKVVNIMDDEGNFGFSGVVRLMEMMRSANARRADVAEMIREAKLII